MNEIYRRENQRKKRGKSPRIFHPLPISLFILSLEIETHTIFFIGIVVQLQDNGVGNFTAKIKYKNFEQKKRTTNRKKNSNTTKKDFYFISLSFWNSFYFDFYRFDFLFYFFLLLVKTHSHFANAPICFFLLFLLLFYKFRLFHRCNSWNVWCKLNNPFAGFN